MWLAFLQSLFWGLPFLSITEAPAQCGFSSLNHMGTIADSPASPFLPISSPSGQWLHTPASPDPPGPMAFFRSLPLTHLFASLSLCTSRNPHTQGAYWVLKGSLLSSSPTLAVTCLFDESHSDRYEVVSHWVLTCISLIISDVEQILTCLLVISMSSLEKYLYRFLCRFLIGLFFWI